MPSSPKKNSYREKKAMSFKKVKELHQIGEDQILQLKMAIQLKDMEMKSNQKQSSLASESGYRQP